MVSENKANRAYKELRNAILSGRFVPGYRIVISDLSRNSDISASPWREAIMRLQAEGWLEVTPNVGARVVEPGLNAHRQTIELLARLEGLATILAIPNLTDADMQALHSIDSKMLENLNVRLDAEFTRLNREFHEIFYARCNFDRLKEAIRGEIERLDFIKKNVQFDWDERMERKPRSVEEHEHLLTLIESQASSVEIEDYARLHKLNALAFRHHMQKD
ncbi:MAG: GntR family transcriptional regulator [Bifidobacterium sp.]|uniref:GntR family transcriptional regulator n=1 Tax=Bifidobacterium fermentum TaxID=3059035 RepID=A0AB39UK74_9BIFI